MEGFLSIIADCDVIVVGASGSTLVESDPGIFRHVFNNSTRASTIVGKRENKLLLSVHTSCNSKYCLCSSVLNWLVNDDE